MFEQDLVRAFHLKFGHPAPERPTLEHYRFMARAKWLLEEALEYAQASGFDVRASVNGDGEPVVTLWGNGKSFDWPGMIDALIDQAYFNFGSFVEMGVIADPHFAEVHRANMTKSTAKTLDGKTIKPVDWQPPNVGRVLDAQLAGRSPNTSEEFQLRELVRSLLVVRDENSAQFEVLRARAWEAEQKLEAARTEIKELLASHQALNEQGKAATAAVAILRNACTEMDGLPRGVQSPSSEDMALWAVAAIAEARRALAAERAPRPFPGVT